MEEMEPKFSLFEDNTEQEKLDYYNSYLKTYGYVDGLEMVLNANLEGFEDLLPDVNFKADNAIFQVFNAFGKDIEIDNAWCTELNKYVYGFSTRKVGEVDYAEFFGAPYLGLQRIMFTVADRNRWFTDIFDVDEYSLRENLLECKAINKNFVISTDVFNISIVYLLYRVYNSNLLDKTKHAAMINLVVMYHYKLLTSIVNNDYKYTAKKEYVLATYNALSLKYDIKKYGTWRALINARAEFIINPRTGIHFKTFTTMNNDLKVIYMVGDIQDRLRGVVNDINKVFHDVKNKVGLVKINDMMVMLDNQINVRDTTNTISKYKNYISTVLSNKNGFYKDELLEYSLLNNNNAPRDKLSFLLKNFPDVYNNDKQPKFKVPNDLKQNGIPDTIEKPFQYFVDSLITHLFEYTHERKIKINKLSDVLEAMRGTYTSSRNDSKELKLLKVIGDMIVKEMTGVKTPIVISSLRLSLMLYLDLRTLTMDHYK